MRSSLPRLFLSLGTLLAVGCTSDSPPGDPLLAGSLSANYDDEAFTPTFGFATTTDGGASYLLLGDGPIHCGSESASKPPPGHTAAFSLPALAVGTYSPVFVNMLDNTGGFEGRGSNGGTVEITAVSADSVTGTVSYDYTDDENRNFAIAGSFEVIRCP